MSMKDSCLSVWLSSCCSYRVNQISDEILNCLGTLIGLGTSWSDVFSGAS